MTASARRYFLQLLVPFVTVAIAYALSSYVQALHDRLALFLFLAAVIASTWFGGLFCGLLATLLAALTTARMYHPHTVPGITDHREMLRWALFVLVAILISSLQASRGRTESALRHSEQRLMLAIDSAHIGVWDYNLLSRDFWWSTTLESIYGRSENNFPSTYGQFFGCIHFDDQPVFNRAITRTIDEGTDYEIEHRITLPDGSIRWVNTRGRLFFNEAARAERIVGVVTDITARKQTEADQAKTSLARQTQGNELSPVG